MTELFTGIAAFVLWVSWLSFDLDDCADVLGLHSQTLRRWLAQRQTTKSPPPWGRPLEGLPSETRTGLIALLFMLGPDISLRSLLACFPSQKGRGRHLGYGQVFSFITGSCNKTIYSSFNIDIS